MVVGQIFGEDQPSKPEQKSDASIITPRTIEPVAEPTLPAEKPSAPEPATPSLLKRIVTPTPLAEPSDILPRVVNGLPIVGTRPTDLAVPTQPLPSPLNEIAYVDASRLNVRSGPGTDFKQVWTLKNNEQVTVVARKDGWAQLTSDRFTGWVFGGYLTSKPAPAPQAVSAPANISTAEVKRRLIERSIALYSGRCPCPYNTMSNGRRCGGNSAHSRPGGASPLCFPSDISAAMVQAYLARQ